MDEERTYPNVGLSVVDNKAMRFSIFRRSFEQSMQECVQPNNMSIKQLSTITFEDGSKTLRTYLRNLFLKKRCFADIKGLALTFNDYIFLCNLTNAGKGNLNLSS